MAKTKGMQFVENNNQTPANPANEEESSSQLIEKLIIGLLVLVALFFIATKYFDRSPLAPFSHAKDLYYVKKGAELCDMPSKMFFITDSALQDYKQKVINRCSYRLEIYRAKGDFGLSTRERFNAHWEGDKYQNMINNLSVER